MRTHVVTFRATLRPALIYLAVLALSAAVAGSVGGQTMVNVATDETDPSNLRDTEPSIAVNPRNPQEIVIVTFSEPWDTDRGAPIWRSTDGGTTWNKLRVISQPATRGTGPGDQSVAFDSAGRLFVAQLESPAAGGQSLFNYIYRQNGSIDSAFLAGLSYGEDQPLVAVDRAATGTCVNRLYSPWLGFPRAGDPDRRERSMVSNSADSGANMASVKAGDNSAHPNRTTRLAVGPNGRVYIVYKAREGAVNDNFENAHFRVVRSDDCGATWNALGATGVPVHAGTVVTWFTQTDPLTNKLKIGFGNPAKGKVARARSSDAWIAVDPHDGDVYVAYVNRDASGFGQIYVTRSRDEGATWVSTRVTDGLNHSAFPEIAVADNGAVGVLYIDYDDSGTDTIFRHRFARSNDDGASWSRKTLQSMNPNLIPVTQSFIWGDYEGLTAFGNTFYGAFAGQSLPGKRTTSQLDPIFFTEPATP